jgi:thioredoxin reductase (NADPH)
MANRKTRLLILGTGPAGWTAAIYAARAGLDPLVLKGLEPGGQLTITTDVENYPGFADVIQGPWLMEQMEAQALHLGVEALTDTAIETDLSSSPFTIKTDRGDSIEAESLIIATGAQAKWLGLDSEQKFMGFGVSACATCDGFFYKNKKVAVIGGGNTAAEEALFLTKFASEVYLVHRRDALRAEKILTERVLANEKITPIWNHTLTEVLGEGEPLGVTGVKLRSTTDDKEQTLTLDGVFIAIGHEPQTKIFHGQLDMKESGIIKTNGFSTATSIAGVFAAGDVADDKYRQAVTAAGLGCMAALEADAFLKI